MFDIVYIMSFGTTIASYYADSKTHKTNKKINLKKSKTMKTFKILFAVIFAITFVSSSFAQTSDEINANATVLQSATVTGEKDLEFGDVTIGEAKEILASDADAGHFTLMTNTSSSISFTLPENLEATIGGVLRLLPVSFANNNYGLVIGLNNAGEEVTQNFNPTSDYNLTGSFDHANVFDIYLGGEVTPAANQAAGDYTAEVTMTVTYN
jgi:hypothetical protein